MTIVQGKSLHFVFSFSLGVHLFSTRLGLATQAQTSNGTNARLACIIDLYINQLAACARGPFILGVAACALNVNKSSRPLEHDGKSRLLDAETQSIDFLIVSSRRTDTVNFTGISPILCDDSQIKSHGTTAAGSILKNDSL